MKKFILLAILAIASLSAAAGTGDAVFNKAIAAYKSAKGIAVKYSMTGAVGNSSGEIIMQGNKFCITASNMICWYNGKTQWSYSTMSNEVSIMEPTASELQEAKDFCAQNGIRHIVCQSEELDIDGFRQNPKNRCYLCKHELFEKV